MRPFEAPSAIVNKSTYTLKDGRRHCINVTELLNYDSGNDEPQPDVIVVGNGAWSRPGNYKPWVTRMLQAAREAGRDTKAVLHGDPWFGRGTYAQDYRTERLAAVTSNTTETSEDSVSVVGHSWGWPCAVRVALGQSEDVSTLCGYTPIGHRDSRAIQPTLRDLVKMSWIDYRHSNVRLRPSSIIGRGLLGLSMGSHSMTGLPTIKREVSRSFTDEMTEQVLAVRRRDIPVGIALAKHEFFFPFAEESQQALTNAGVTFETVDVTHSDALVIPENGAALYGLMHQLIRRSV